MKMNQHTIKQAYHFEGKGLHTGTYAHMTLLPAPANTGIRFQRIDIEEKPVVEALAEFVTNTARSTTLSHNGAEVVTVEHILSALMGLGVDNALIELDNREVPILNGSAQPYCEAILKDGLEDQGVARRFIDIPYCLEVRDQRSGSWVRIEPADAPSADVTVDFNSPVLGVQKTHWDLQTDYATQIGVCRTFCFYREIEALIKNNLIKGGDLDNALVVTDEGYLGNPELHFPDECGRHKLLDLLGDIRLAGGYLNARISAYKSGHTINTKAAKALRALLK